MTFTSASLPLTRVPSTLMVPVVAPLPAGAFCAECVRIRGTRRSRLPSSCPAALPGRSRPPHPAGRRDQKRPTLQGRPKGTRKGRELGSRAGTRNCPCTMLNVLVSATLARRARPGRGSTARREAALAGMAGKSRQGDVEALDLAAIPDHRGGVVPGHVVHMRAICRGLRIAGGVDHVVQVHVEAAGHREIAVLRVE